MDTDGNGKIDLQEFAHWFCMRPISASGSDMLKMKLQMKMFIRQVSDALNLVAESGIGRPCVNQLAVNIGDIEKENSRGMIKAYFMGCSSEALYTSPRISHGAGA